MELLEITKILLGAKKEKSLSFADLETIVGRDEVWIAAVFYRQASASQEEAEKLYLPWDSALMRPKRLPNAP